jgi:hypothetical protein
MAVSDFKVGDRVRYLGGAMGPSSLFNGTVEKIEGDILGVRPDHEPEGFGLTHGHQRFFTRIEEPKQWRVGDTIRERRTGRVGVIVRMDALTIGIDYGTIREQADTDTLSKWYERIEEAKPWEGECVGCSTDLDARTAHIITPWDGQTVQYLCWDCWRLARGWDVPFTPSHVSLEQNAGLERSRQWMAERYPDNPKWQETT